MNILVIFGQMIMLFVMMLLGYFVYKRKWVTEESTVGLSKMVVNLFNPILIVYSVLSSTTVQDSSKMMQNLTLMIVFFALLILLSFVLVFVLRIDKPQKSMYRMMSIFPNIGFMGIPVVKSIYGNDAVIYVAFYILGYNLLLYTYGVILANRVIFEERGESTKRGKSDLKATLAKIMNPGVVASILAIIIYLAGIQVPAVVTSFCDYVGNATVSLSMMLIGISIAQSKIGTMFKDVKMYAYIALRMVLLPIVIIMLMRQMSIDPIVFGVFILELGMPVGSIVTLMIKETGADVDQCSKGIVLSTLAAIVTIPIVCMFL